MKKGMVQISMLTQVFPNLKNTKACLAAVLQTALHLELLVTTRTDQQ